MEPSPTDSSMMIDGVVRYSQRQPLTCFECSRRKQRCDKQIPCQNCVKRGKGNSCHVEETVKRPPAQRKRIRQYASTQTVHSLSLRVSHLESQLTSVVSQLNHKTEEGGPGVGVRLDSFSFAPDQGDGGRLGRDEEEEEGGTDSDEDGFDQEADAAATLEFLAMGRSRAKSPGGGNELEEEEPENDTLNKLNSPPSPLLMIDRNTGPSYYPSSHHIQPQAPRQIQAPPYFPRQPGPPGIFQTHASQSTSQGADYKTLMRNSVIDCFPEERFARQLVQFDVECVSWLHCCYHGPSVLIDCEAFWRDGMSGEVELNWSWLALYFGIMMSALQHMPQESIRALTGSSSAQKLIRKYFEACLTCLQLANWMENHSLFAVQCVAIIISTANHLGKSDLYFTMLGAAIRVAQALNLNHVGPDSYSLSAESTEQTPVQLSSKALISREVKKRTWWQLVIQDWFHAAFNRSNAISQNQFDTPTPLHCFDIDMANPSQLKPLSLEIPSMDSHIKQLLKLAITIHKYYRQFPHRGCVSYQRVMEIDNEMKGVLNQAPSWMKFDPVTEMPNPVTPSENLPSWLQWQRMNYMISAAHKVIVIHRPYLGRAFRDKRYAYSRQVSVTNAKRILLWFTTYSFEPFRKTWTTLAHAVAASVVLLLEIMHGADDTSPAPQVLLPLVLDSIEVFRSVQHSSHIAARGMEMITAMVEEYRMRNVDKLNKKQRAESFGDRSRAEMNNALQVIGASREHILKRKSVSGKTPPATKHLMTPPMEQVTPPAFAQHAPPQSRPQVSNTASYGSQGEYDMTTQAIQSPFQWLAANPATIGQNVDTSIPEHFMIPEFGGTEGFYADWDYDLTWAGAEQVYDPGTG